ncbi:hypothetical protein HCZ87_19370, partial [Phaeobacter sp. HF9A]|nr:hypothetical protein [Phaeobacter sp. HF9A]
RVAETEARPLIRRVARDALTLATAQEAAEGIRVSGGSGANFASLEDSLRSYDALVEAHMLACAGEVDAVLDGFGARIERAHETFLDRATHALITHLQDWGDSSPWQYDPTGLRLLLRSACSVMGKRLQEQLEDRYSEALSDVARHLYDAFGARVEGIQIAVPDAPPLPAPVALAQTIALDVRDSWWGNWWRRTRGYASFAETYRSQISAETQPFMTALKVEQCGQIRSAALACLADSLRQHRDILVEIAEASAEGRPSQNLAPAGDDAKPAAHAAALTTLRALIA